MRATSRELVQNESRPLGKVAGVTFCSLDVRGGELLHVVVFQSFHKDRVQLERLGGFPDGELVRPAGTRRSAQDRLAGVAGHRQVTKAAARVGVPGLEPVDGPSERLDERPPDATLLADHLPVFRQRAGALHRVLRDEIGIDLVLAEVLLKHRILADRVSVVVHVGHRLEVVDLGGRAGEVERHPLDRRVSLQIREDEVERSAVAMRGGLRDREREREARGVGEERDEELGDLVEVLALVRRELRERSADVTLLGLLDLAEHVGRHVERRERRDVIGHEAHADDVYRRVGLDVQPEGDRSASVKIAEERCLHVRGPVRVENEHLPIERMEHFVHFVQLVKDGLADEQLFAAADALPVVRADLGDRADRVDRGLLDVVIDDHEVIFALCERMLAVSRVVPILLAGERVDALDDAADDERQRTHVSCTPLKGLHVNTNKHQTT